MEKKSSMATSHFHFGETGNTETEKIVKQGAYLASIKYPEIMYFASIKHFETMYVTHQSNIP